MLTNPNTYRLEPREAWRRIKFRNDKARPLAILREVAAWREEEAQRRDLPRNRVLRDETLCEIAAHAPSDVEHLARCRGLSRSIAENRQGAQILAAVKRGLELPASECPEPTPRRDLPSGIGPLIELLRVLLKMRCEDHDVAQKLIASADDLELIAADDGAEVPALAWLAPRDLRRRRAGPEAWPPGADGGRPAREGGARPRGLSHPIPLLTCLHLCAVFRKRGEGRCYRAPRAFALAVATERPTARPRASRRRSTASPYMTPPFFGSTRVRRSPARRRLVSRSSFGVAPDKE